jgi:uncharacterized membrane protein
MDSTKPQGGEAKETGRLEAFSDGVFAVAITLLVLDIKTPKAADLAAGHTGLIDALLAQWPAYLSYVLSFLTVLIMWANHHEMFRHIRRVDDTFLLLNGLLLLFITLAPFPTSLLAEYIMRPEARTAAMVYCGMFIGIGVFFNAMWIYASHKGRLLVKDYDRTAVKHLTRGYLVAPLVYVAALLLAFVSVAACMGLCYLLTMYFALPGKKKRRAA